MPDVNRRGFLKAALGAICAPAFVKASSLWLPPEKLFVPEIDTSYLDVRDDFWVSSHRRIGKTYLMLQDWIEFHRGPLFVNIQNA